MFERLKGELEEIQVDYIVIGTSSFSYRVNISLRTIQNLPPLNSPITLYLHPIYKESEITLYGFDNTEDREIFRDLLTVNKVGPRTAINILSLYSRDEIINFITSGRVKDLTRASGLGKRGAEMIITALKDKYKNVKINLEESEGLGAIEKLRNSDQIFNEAVEALTILGFSWEVSSNTIRSVYHQGITVEELIKEALLRLNE